MTTFVFINWVLCSLTSISLAILLWRYRFLFIKPSMVIIFFFHIQIQWAATINSGYIESYLLDPIPFASLSHAFPLIGLFVSFFTLRHSTIIVWRRITTYSQKKIFKPNKRAIFVLAACMLVLTVWYLSYVPLLKTGLYSIFFDPLRSVQAREESLKLISNIPLKYAYAILRSTIAPLLAVLSAFSLVYHFKKKRMFYVNIDIFILVGTFLIISLTGARSPAAMVMLSIFFAFFLKKGMAINLFQIISAFAIVLSFPVILTILRGAHEISVSTYFQNFTGTILHRVFVGPMLTALWHVDHVQHFGYFGVAAVHKLAILLGIDPINVANIIALEHFSHIVTTGLSNTCYVFSYYSYFGIFSIILSLFGLWILDLAILIYTKLNDLILLACVASVSVVCILFISMDFTTVIMTHGFGPLIIFALFLNLFCRIKFRLSLRKLLDA